MHQLRVHRPPDRGRDRRLDRHLGDYHNAVIEAWHSTLEFELRSVEHFETKAAARAAVSAWIEDYNIWRRHSALGMMSPVDYEQALKAGQAA